MKELLKKLRLIEKETAEEKGEYNLFALFLREDSPNKWDILVSASWTGNKGDALDYLAKKIQYSFTHADLLMITRIVIIDEDNPFLPELLDTISVEHGFAEIRNSTYFGLEIKHGYIITSRSRQAA